MNFKPQATHCERCVNTRLTLCLRQRLKRRSLWAVVGMGDTLMKSKMLQTALLAGALCVMTTQSYAQGSCTQYGDQTFCSDGSSSQRYGNQTYYSDGTNSQQYGNQTYYSGSPRRSAPQFGESFPELDGMRRR